MPSELASQLGLEEMVWWVDVSAWSSSAVPESTLNWKSSACCSWVLECNNNSIYQAMDIGGRCLPPPPTPDPHTQGKEIGDSFIPCGLKLQDGNSRAIKGGSWALPRSCISRSWSLETSRTTHAQKGSLQVKDEGCQGRFCPQAFAAESMLAERCVCTQGRILR